MLKALFGSKQKEQIVSSSEQPGQLAGVQNGITSNDIDSILTTTGQSHMNISEALRSDPLGGITTLKVKKAFTKAEAKALEKVAAETKVLAQSTKEAADYLVQITEDGVSINKDNNRVIAANLVATTAKHGSNSKVGELAQKQREHHFSNAVSYQNVVEGVNARIQGRLAGLGL